MEPTQNTQQEIYRLVKDNNRMLRAMRRNAFIWGIVKFLLYVGLLVALPLWLYATYLAPVLESTMETMRQIQGTGAEAQSQMNTLQEALNRFDLTQYFER